MGEVPNYILLRKDSEPLTLEPGFSHSIVIHTEAERSELLEVMADDSRIWLVPEDGGLITNIRVWENMTLPVQYHHIEIDSELPDKVMQLMMQCGWQDEGDVSVLMRKLPEQLSLYEKKLVGFVRTMLVEPVCVGYDFLYKGLTRAELDRVSIFDRVFQQNFPASTSISLGFKANEDASNPRQRIHHL